jgi:hypothetical protein
VSKDVRIINYFVSDRLHAAGNSVEVDGIFLMNFKSNKNFYRLLKEFLRLRKFENLVSSYICGV